MLSKFQKISKVVFDKNLSVKNTYRHVIIKRPNGLVTICRSTKSTLRNEAKNIMNNNDSKDDKKDSKSNTKKTQSKKSKINKKTENTQDKKDTNDKVNSEDKKLTNFDDLDVIYVNTDFTKHIAWCGGKRQIKSSVNDQFMRRYKHSSIDLDIE